LADLAGSETGDLDWKATDSGGIFVKPRGFLEGDRLLAGAPWVYERERILIGDDRSKLIKMGLKLEVF
jgi:hypothetical protein